MTAGTITRRTALGLFGVAGATAMLGCHHDADAVVASPLLQGYAWPPTVRDTLQLFVATTAPFFAVEIYRIGSEARAAVFGPFAGESAPRGTADAAWGWASTAIPIALPAGAYVAVLRACDSRGVVTDDAPQLATANGEMKIVFAVRGASPAKILYKLPLFTYHAYNQTGGASLYGVWDVVTVTMQRPGGGSGHTRTGAETGELFADGLLDPLGEPFDRQWNTFERWDAKLLRWMVARGYAFDVCTDWELHAEPELLAPYTLLVSAGHDEYWSDAMRDHVEAFVDRGGNVAFFGGNTCFWRVEVDLAAGAVTCNKVANSAGHWDHFVRDDGTTRYENALTGMCEHAGGYNSAARMPLGYTVIASDLWPLAGVTATEFGAASSLVGYEVDGAPVDANLALTFARDTPASFHVVAQAVLPSGAPSADGWYTPAIDDGAPGVAMIGLFNRTGTVFNAGTTDWPRVLGDATVAQITANVIDRLSTRTLVHRIVDAPAPAATDDAELRAEIARRITLAQPIVACAACAGGAVVAVADGNLYQLAWTGDGRAIRDVLPYFGADRTTTIKALAGVGDGVRVLDSAGVVHELVWA